MRIFLDVGANTGQTVSAVLDPVYKFDKIVCFEPVRQCYEQLLQFKDPRITAHQYGLWKETCERPLFAPGTLRGSIFSDMNKGAPSETCKLVRASDWFRDNIAPEDVVFLKLNCEGAECDIVDDLLDSSEFDKVDFMMIDFDVRKIPSQRHREKEVRSRLKKYQPPRVSFCKDVMIGPNHSARIQNWLRVVGADRKLGVSVLIFSSGQKKLLKKTLKSVRRKIDFGGVPVRWLISDDYVDHPKIHNSDCRAFIKETGLFNYCYFPERNQGLGKVVNHLYGLVDTPYVLHMEHDWKFRKKIQLGPLIEIMEGHEEISCIRFNKKISKAAPVLFWLDEPERERKINGITLTETKSWTFNPTLYRTAHVKQALPIDSAGSEGSFKTKMSALGFKSFSLGKAQETYVKHLRGISCGTY